MTARSRRGLFVAEGSSDMPLADVVESLFLDRGVPLVLARPDFGMLPAKVNKDVGSRLKAGRDLVREHLDLVVVHRDADNAGADARLAEIRSAVVETAVCAHVVPIVPIRMTEAWLLLDEDAIRTVAGNQPATRAAQVRSDCRDGTRSSASRTPKSRFARRCWPPRTSPADVGNVSSAASRRTGDSCWNGRTGGDP